MIDCVLDVDTGTDDAQALLLALRHSRLNVLAVTTVNGNTGVRTVTEATLRVLDAANAPINLPVAVGCAAPLVEPVQNCPQIHGTDSLGDLGDLETTRTRTVTSTTTSSRTVVSDHAVTFLAKLLQERIAIQAQPLTLIALAPLTNIAMLVRMAPELVRRGVREIVWMGGTLKSGGNASSWAEANAAYDPEAAHIVLSSCGVPVLMYPWDVYEKVAFTVPELEAYGCCCRLEEKGENNSNNNNKNIPSSSLEMAVQHQTAKPSWTQLSTRLLLRDMKHFQMSSASIGDAGAVAALLLLRGDNNNSNDDNNGNDNDDNTPAAAVETKHLHVQVELQGKHTRGMTVVDVREHDVFPPDKPKEPPNVHVVVDVNAKALKTVFAEAVFR